MSKEIINDTNKTMELTGIATASNPVDAESDFVDGLLAAANYKEDIRQEIEIKMEGKVYFSFFIRSISDTELNLARKKARKMMPNPTNRKLPMIEKEFDNTMFYNWIIYLATTDEYREKVWNNAAVKKAYNIIDPSETVDILLMTGEKSAIVDVIMELSGMNDENVLPVEDAVKN